MLNYEKASAPLAQLDRVSVYGTEGWGFELLMVRHSKMHIVLMCFFFLQKKYIHDICIFSSLRAEPFCYVFKPTYNSYAISAKILRLVF